MDAKIDNHGTLSGTLSGKPTLSGELSGRSALYGNLSVLPVGGTKNYEKLTNKPKIESVELIGDKSFEDLGVRDVTNMELQSMLDNIFN